MLFAIDFTWQGLYDYLGQIPLAPLLLMFFQLLRNKKILVGTLIFQLRKKNCAYTIKGVK